LNDWFGEIEDDKQPPERLIFMIAGNVDLRPSGFD